MHPVVVIETTEEERLDDELRAVAAELRIPLFTWTVTRGLQRIDGSGAIFFVDLPTEAERAAIFGIHLRTRKQQTDAFDAGALASRILRCRDRAGRRVGVVSVAVRQPLTTAVLLEEIRQTAPLSTSRREDIEQIRHEARGRFVPVA